MGSDADDAALVEAWRGGSAEAARRAIEIHGAAMLRVALALCPRAEDAEDVVQDALLRAHRSLANFNSDRGTLRAWLVGVTANRARQVRRARSRHGSFLARMRREPYALAAPSWMHGDLAFARRRLAALPAGQRAAFVLVEIEELSSAEAAAILKISASTVRVLVSRARRRLEVATIAPARELRVEGKGN